ncbi:MAG: hypothetical protein HXY21_13950 [Parvularculaceae bacterium]|nr:hypothetical protein [Parvularculaceae bacterium]
MKRLATALALGAALLATNGCVLVAAAGAGYLVHDEATEDDGTFDPLEDVRDVEDGKN